MVRKSLNQHGTLVRTLPKVLRIIKWLKNTHTASRTAVDIARNVYVNFLTGCTSWICPQLWSWPTTASSSLTIFAKPLLHSLFFPMSWGHAVRFSHMQRTAVLVFLAYKSWVYRKSGSLLQKFSRKEFLGRLPKSCTVFLESSHGIWEALTPWDGWQTPLFEDWPWASRL